MRIVGLTGGIGSGKSTVSNLFKSHGIPVVDADIVARDALKKGTGGWKKVVAAFGEEILRDDGEVDRPKLGQIVFSDPAKRQLLNRLLAPYISSGILREVLKLWLKGLKIIVLDIPLLFEAKMDRWTNPIIVVWVDPETQLQRIIARDRSSEEDARNRIGAQMPLDLKRSKADIVIDNTGSLEDLNERFKEVLLEVTRPLTWKEFVLSRQDKLVALDKVHGWRPEVDPISKLCAAEVESRSHLFFCYSFSQSLWSRALLRSGIQRSISDWHMELHWALSNMRGKTIHVLLLKLC